MKKILIATLALLACIVGHAQQKTTISEKELRNPKLLRPWLEANATDAQTRISTLQGYVFTNTASAITQGNLPIAQMTNALTAPGAIGGTTPAAGAFTTLSSSGTTTLATSLTGALRATAGVVSAQAGYTGTNTVIDAAFTNTIEVIGGVITGWTQTAVGE